MNSRLSIRPEPPSLEAALATFVRESWERSIASLPGVTGGPLVSEDELFRALVETGSHSIEDEASRYVVWVGGELQEHPEAFAARSEDGSLLGYISRLTAQAAEREFTVLLPNPHRYDHTVRARVREIAGMLAKYAGIPCGGFDSGIFLGRYGKTPFGVHRGQMSVLTFPVLGTKRFLTWPRPYGEEHTDIQDSLSYAHHLPSATVLTARPGDIAYWPADYWHIADGPVAVSAALNIGLWWDRPALDVSLRVFAESLSNDDGAEPDPRECFNLHARQGSSALEQALQRIARAAQSATTRAQIELRWLSLLSASGMRDTFPTRSLTFDSPVTAVRAKLRQGEAIHTARLATGQLGVALLGHTIAIDSDSTVSDDVARLNHGGSVLLKLEALRQSGEQDDRRSFERLLAESLACELFSPGQDACT
jgi:hypothetical protein